MKPTVPFTLNENTITCVIDGAVYSIQRSNAQAKRIIAGLKDGASPETLVDLFNTAAAIKRFMHDRITVADNNILYKGTPVHNVVSDRILQFMREGLPYEPLINFLDKLLDNPSARSVEQLYGFLEKYNMAITPSGTFLAYKAVRPDWTDKHSGTINNQIGNIVRMDRNKVDDDPASPCSRGLHVGSMEYVGWFGSDGDNILIVEVNPANAVAVPYDCSMQKIRVCEYRVVGTYDGLIVRPFVNDADNPYSEIEEDEDPDTIESSDDGFSDDGGSGYDSGFNDGVTAAADTLSTVIDGILGL